MNYDYSGGGILDMVNTNGSGGGISNGIQRRRGRGGGVTSISKAINLKSTSSSSGSEGSDKDRRQQGKEKVGEILDTVDSWSIETGTFLRNNPIARLFFLLYLLLLHLWVLGMLVFHAHTFEVEHGDFGSYRHMEQVHGHPPSATVKALLPASPNSNIDLPGQ